MYVPLLANSQNQEGWGEVVSKEVMDKIYVRRHTHTHTHTHTHRGGGQVHCETWHTAPLRCMLRQPSSGRPITDEGRPLALCLSL